MFYARLVSKGRKSWIIIFNRRPLKLRKMKLYKIRHCKISVSLAKCIGELAAMAARTRSWNLLQGALGSNPSCRAKCVLMLRSSSRLRAGSRISDGEGGAEGYVRAAHVTNAKPEVPHTAGWSPGSDLWALEALGIKCSLMLSEPYFEAFWYKTIFKRYIVDLFFGGGAVTVGPPPPHPAWIRPLHLHVKPYRNALFPEIEWGVVISRQLRGLRGQGWRHVPFVGQWTEGQRIVHN